MPEFLEVISSFYGLKASNITKFSVDDAFVKSAGFSFKKTNGFYMVTDNSLIAIYVGKGGAARAKISMKAKDGNSVMHFEVEKGFGNQSLHDTSFIFEELLTRKFRAEGNLKNAIKSPGHKKFEDLSPELQDKFTKEFNRKIESGGIEYKSKSKSKSNE